MRECKFFMRTPSFVLGTFLCLSVVAFGQTSTPYFSVERLTVTPALKNPFAALIDFNSDGALDLVVAQSYATDPTTPFAPITPRAFQNDGKGHFTEVTAKVFSDLKSLMITPSGRYSVADFDGDGRADLFIADFGPDVDPHVGAQNRLFLQTADGRLSDQTARLPQVPNSLSVGSCTADVNHDGAPDLVVPSYGPGAVVYLNDGHGNFPTSSMPQPNIFAYSCAFADFNRDGSPDLLIGTSGTKPPGDIDAIIFNDWTGRLSAPESLLTARPVAQTDSLGLGVADFDGDGWPDIVRGVGFLPASIQFLHNLGDGNFADESDRIPAFPNTSTPLVDIFVADFNGDGWPDFITQGLDTPRLFINDGTGHFIDATAALPSLQGAYVLGVGDLDGDGATDIVAVPGNGPQLIILRNLKPYMPAPNPYLPATTGPSISAAGAANVGSSLARSIAPGEIVVLYGSQIGPPALVSAALGSDGLIQTTVGGTSVTFDGVAAPLVYSYQGQVAVYAPYEIAGKHSTQIQVTYNGQKSNPIRMPVSAAAPGILTANSSGTGQAAAVNLDGTLNGPALPVDRGGTVILFATGEGVTKPASVDGVVYVDTLPAPVLPVVVTVGGQVAHVGYAGRAPYTSGVMQLNVTVPQNISAGAAEVLLYVGSSISRPGVTISVR
jgi:uncharacterized protein (TIGR03437 family)